MACSSLLVLALLAFVASTVSAHDDVHTNEVPSGQLLPQILTEANFEEHTSSGKWLIKFYAPWCSHCKTLAPVWQQLANDVVEANMDVNIAQVDCTVASAACASADVRGYPTIVYIDRAAKLQLTYKDKRVLSSFMDFLKKLNGPVVHDVASAADALKDLVASRSVTFLLITTDTSSNTEPVKAFTDACKTNILDVECFKIKASKSELYGLKAPALVVLKDGKHVKYEGEWESTQISKWILENNFAQWMQLTTSVFMPLFQAETHNLVILALDGSQDNSGFISVLRRVAHDTPNPAWNYRFFWVDINTWPDLASIWGLQRDQLPVLAVFEPSTHYHYIADSVGTTNKGLVVSDIKQFLDDVLEGKIKPLGNGKSIGARITRELGLIAQNIEYGVYSFKAEYPNVFIGVVSLCMFAIVHLIVTVYKSAKASNVVVAPAAASAPKDATTADQVPAQSAEAAEAASTPSPTPADEKKEQ